MPLELTVFSVNYLLMQHKKVGPKALEEKEKVQISLFIEESQSIIDKMAFDMYMVNKSVGCNLE